jgi:hypothetical protein
MAVVGWQGAQDLDFLIHNTLARFGYSTDT